MVLGLIEKDFFSLGNEIGRNIIFFGVDMSSDIDMRKNIFWFLVKVLHKDSEIVAYPLWLGNISKEWSVDNMKKAALNGYAYDFSVDYNAISVANVFTSI